jgi:hypothetical protein
MRIHQLVFPRAIEGPHREWCGPLRFPQWVANAIARPYSGFVCLLDAEHRRRARALSEALSREATKNFFDRWTLNFI